MRGSLRVLGRPGEGKAVSNARCKTLVVFCVEGLLFEAREHGIFVKLDILFRHVVVVFYRKVA